MRPTPFRVTLSAALLLLAVTAAADDGPGNDRVRLKNGGMLRGTIVESEPGGVVKVVVAGEKQPKVIPWADVAGVDFEKFEPKPAAAPSAPPPPTPPPTPPSAPPSPPPRPVIFAEPPPGVTVHIASPKRVILHANTDTVGVVGRYGVMLSTRRTLCVSPCDEPIDVRHEPELSIGGDGVTESGRFSLADTAGNVQLDVSPGSRGTFVAGLWLTGLGAGAVVGGLLLVAVESAATPVPTVNSDGSTSPGSNGGAVTTGAVIAGIGGTVLIGGIIALVSGRTTVEVHGGGVASAARAPNYWAGEF